MRDQAIYEAARQRCRESGSRSNSAFPDGPSQPPEAVTQSRFHCPSADLERLGDLDVGETFEVVHPQDDLTRRRNRRENIGKIREKLGFERRIRFLGGHFHQLGGIDDGGLAAGTASVAYGVSCGDPKCPGAKPACVAKRPELSADDEHRLLEHVLGRVLVAQQAADVPIQGLLYGGEQLIERTEVAELSSGDERWTRDVLRARDRPRRQGPRGGQRFV